MMKIKLIFILLFFSTSINAQWHLFGETDVKPGVPYEYAADRILGVLSNSTYTWKVTNGKIKDQNGNYTLSTIVRVDRDIYYKPISIIWDCLDLGETAMLEIVEQNASWDINVKPCNVVIANKEYIYSSDEEGMYLVLANVYVKKNAKVNFNGYHSVSILPGFLAEQGSTVRIYNSPADVVVPQLKKSATTEIKDRKTELYCNKLYQNSPNPAYLITTITYEISKIKESAYVNVYDSMGVLAIKIPISSIGSNQIDINTSGLANGIYMYSLIVDGSLIDTKRMVIAN